MDLQFFEGLLHIEEYFMAPSMVKRKIKGAFIDAIQIRNFIY